MSVFLGAVLECLGFVAFIAVFYGVPCLLWLYICWRRDQKRGRKWGR